MQEEEWQNTNKPDWCTTWETLKQGKEPSLICSTGNKTP